MKLNRLPIELLFISFMLLVLAISYSIWHYLNAKGQQFTCTASFVQHFTNDTLFLSLNYRIAINSGTLNMYGYSKNEPHRKFNRKINFDIEKKEGIYYFHSKNNQVFPDDNVDDEWLSKYEPAFFVYPGKDISLQIQEQSNGNYLFVLSTLPTYICHSR